MREALRNPNDVLNSLSVKAKEENYSYQRLYRNFYNPNFYLLAYQHIYNNKGSMTKGVDGKTLNGMGMERILGIIEKMKSGKYEPSPVRREYIPKKNGKNRPLGIPSADDKLVQEVLRMLLESIYEPTFSHLSHGFRPNRSCHTALQQIQKSFISFASSNATLSFNLLLSMVRSCSNNTKDFLFNPSTFIITCVGISDFSFLLVIAATIVVGLCLLPISFCMISTGLSPPCSLPITGLKSA